MQYIGGIRVDSVNLDLLRALDRTGGRVAHSRDLADTLGTSVQFVTGKLRPLVSAGLISKHWGGENTPGRAYAITRRGHDHVARIDSTPELVSN
jgi:predicted transcriptional regulator